MKKHRFAKFLLSMLLLGGAFGLSACESADHNATVPTEQCEVRVIEDSVTHEKTAVVTLGIYNNTIYNVKQVEFTWKAYFNDVPVPGGEGTQKVDIFVRHGVAGYLSYTVKVEKGVTANYVKITSSRVSGYYSFWETYVTPFVVMFILAGLALIFAAVDIFRNDISKEELKETLSEKLSLYLVIFGLTILICLIPLMFSNWVVTLILIGGFVGVAALTAAMFGIKAAVLKKK